MPSRCCVGGCQSNYDEEIERTGEVVPVFSFPSYKDRVRKRKLWFDSLPSVVEDTTSKKICIKHWPARYATVNRTGHEVPLDPSSVFGLPSSYCRQTIDQLRDVEVRGIDSESRNRRKENREIKVRKEKDRIKSMDKLKIFCQTLPNIAILKRDGNFQLQEMSDEIPPVHLYSICIIYNDFSIECYKSGYYIYVRDLLKFYARLEMFSQLENIINRVRRFELNSADIANTFGSSIESILKENNDGDNESLKSWIMFLVYISNHATFTSPQHLIWPVTQI